MVDTFLQTGNLVGAGGHVFYESVRGGSRGTTGRGKGCFVSLADQVRVGRRYGRGGIGGGRGLGVGCERVFLLFLFHINYYR